MKPSFIFFPSPYFFFWERHPALFSALFLSLGTLFALNISMVWIPALLVVLPFLLKAKYLALATALFFGAGMLVSFRFEFPKETRHGTYHFHCERLTPTQTPFSKAMRYSGTLKSGLNIPCYVIVKEGPMPNKDYLITGKLYTRNHKSYTLKPDKKKPWVGIKNTYSFAHIRYKLKSAIKYHLKNKIPHTKSAQFLSGLATGEFEDPLLFSTFKRLGLVHLLCISGFHFALIAFCLHICSRIFFSLKMSAAIVLTLLSMYYLFIGMTPPIERAWIGASVYLVGILIERKGSPLNSMGIALCILILWHPTKCLTLGFGFSYLATAALLLLYLPFDHLLQTLFPNHRFSFALTWPLSKQLSYLLTITFRKTFALSLAVHAVVIPLSFFHFQHVSLLSLFTNLIFPFLFSLSLILLILSAPLHFLFPFLESQLHLLNSTYTGALIDFAEKIPRPFTATLYVESFSVLPLTLYFSLLFAFGISYRYTQHLKKQWYTEPLSLF